MGYKKFCALHRKRYFHQKSSSLMEVCRGLSIYLDTVKDLLSRGADVNEVSEWGTTPLHYVCMTYRVTLEVLKEMLNHGAEVNKHDNCGLTPLHYLCRNVSIELELLRELLNHGAEVNSLDGHSCSALHYLSKNTQIKWEVYRELFNHGAEVNILDEDGFSPLHYVLMKRYINLDILSELLNHGADVNQLSANGNSPLNIACMNSDVKLEVVKKLVNHGAKINRDVDTALHDIILENSSLNVNVVEYLLRCCFTCTKRMKRVRSVLVEICDIDNTIPIEYLKLLLKYAVLENPNSEFTVTLDISPTDEVMLYEFTKKCSAEIIQMRSEIICVKKSLYSLLLSWSKTRKSIGIIRRDQFLDKVLQILSLQKYPVYGSFIAFILPCRLGRAAMLNKLQDRIYSYVSANESNNLRNRGFGIFNFDSVCCILRYLADEDFSNLIAAIPDYR